MERGPGHIDMLDPKPLANKYDHLSTVAHLMELNTEKLVYKRSARSEMFLNGQPGNEVLEILA
jgi:hypothetical protein